MKTCVRCGYVRLFLRAVIHVQKMAYAPSSTPRESCWGEDDDVFAIASLDE